MNRIRTAAAAVAMLVGAATIAGAQAATPQPAKDGKAARGQHGAMASLDLSTAQKEQIKAIHEKYREQFQQLRQQQQAEIRALLTAEQQAKFDARQAQMRERRAQHDSTRKARGDGKRGHRPHRGARPGRQGEERGRN